VDIYRVIRYNYRENGVEMKCPYCEQKTTVKETFIDLSMKNAPANVTRFIRAHGWQAPVQTRRRRCHNPPCKLRFESVEMSFQDLQAFVEHAVTEALATAQEAS